jgi:catechol 2,3-dioxygenase-like lactoylglutathione lyase family enzyme
MAHVIVALDHVQVAMPPGREEEAARFYGELLGLARVPKPEPLASRGGCWFEQAEVRIHLGIEPDFTPSKKAHVALRVANLDALAARAESHGLAVKWSTELPVRRFYLHDPFGNRIELIEA